MVFGFAISPPPADQHVLKKSGGRFPAVFRDQRSRSFRAKDQRLSSHPNSSGIQAALPGSVKSRTARFLPILLAACDKVFGTTCHDLAIQTTNPGSRRTKRMNPTHCARPDHFSAGPRPGQPRESHLPASKTAAACKVTQKTVPTTSNSRTHDIFRNSNTRIRRRPNASTESGADA